MIQSLDRGLQILEIIAHQRRPMSVTELSEKLSIDKSTAFRLLATLQKHDLVYQVENRKYALGPRLTELGDLVFASMDVRAIAQPFLRELVEKLDETAYLGIMLGGHPVYADRVDSSRRVVVVSHVGERAAGHCTAMGKALCAYLPAEKLVEVLGADPLPAYTPRTITSLSDLMSNFAKVRQVGYATDDEESYLGVRCVAAPVFDHESCVVASIGISLPASRLPLERIDETGHIVSGVAHSLSRRLGFRETDDTLGNSSVSTAEPVLKAVRAISE